MSKCIICGRELTTSEPIEMYNGKCAKCYYEEQNDVDDAVTYGTIGRFKILSEEEYIRLQNQIKLKQQLAKQGQEIKLKNDKLCELKRQLRDCQNALKRKTQSNRDLQSLRYKANRQFAINELAEVERLLYESHYREIDGKYYAEYEDIKNLIDNRIKGLERRENDD